MSELKRIRARLVEAQEQLRLTEHALQQSREELVHAARIATLGLLTAAISHEVNQPLSGIMANAAACLRILAAGAPNLDRARETARRTLRDCNRAAEVVARLRRLSTKGKPTREAVDLAEAAREVVALAGYELRRNGVAVRLVVPDTLPAVMGDPVQLQQVLLNLVLNACEAMRGVKDRRKELTIRMERRRDGHVLLRVKDAGIGIDAQDPLFQPFYTTKPGGMGIGLSVSRAIVESHRGRMWCEPNARGPGATFSLSIPGASGARGTA